VIYISGETIEYFIRPSIHTARLYILTSIPYVNDRMDEGELEILACVLIEAHDIDILNGLILACLIVEKNGLDSTSVQGLT